MVLPQFDPKTQYLVAVSGGPDSMALLDMMFQQGLDVSVAHVNYHLRESSIRDELIVRKYCVERNLPVYVHNVEKKVVGNLQSWARSIRYDFFQSIAQQKGIHTVVVAHHLNDVIESYVMQKARKVITDQYGIPSISRINGITVVRPLLSKLKQELIEYCDENHISYGIDETNLKAVYTRNRYRIQLSRLTSSELESMIKQLELDNVHLKEVENRTDEFEKNFAINNYFDIKVFNLLNDEVKMKVLDRFLIKQTGQKNHFRFALLVQIISWLSSSDNCKDFATRTWKLTVIKGGLHLMYPSDDELVIKSISMLPVKLGDYTISMIDSDSNISYIPVVESDFPLRFCRPAPIGSKLDIRGHQRSVRKVLADHKVPAALRSSYYSVFNSSGKCLGIVGILTHQGVLNRKNMLFVLK